MQGQHCQPSHLLPYGPFRLRVLLAMVRHHWFIRLRWIIAFATAVLLLVERVETPDFHRPHAVLFCIGALAVVNLLWTIIGRDLLTETNVGGIIPPVALRHVALFANAQMTVDLLVLTVILRYSGGVENPMAVFYLFHVLISTLLLTPLNAVAQGCWALLLYGGLAVGECVGFITPHYPFLASTANAELHADWLYVLASMGVLGAGVFGTFFFARQISRRVEDQENELHDVNEALRWSQAAIHDLQARRSRFMQTAAHQLKSPLATIETLAGLIRDKVVARDAADGILARIVTRCRQAILQVSELLTLARVQEAAPAKHHAAATEISEVIRKVSDEFAEQAKARGITLQVASRGCTGARASVDARDLEDCLSNLVDNAIKYTPDGGSVWISAKSEARTVSISVKDTGMGISEDSENDLFDPFRRGNLALASNVPGSGLGLAIVLEVVEQANGRIEVQSTPGKGSEFTLTFPKHNSDKPSMTVRSTRTATLANHESSAEQGPDPRVQDREDK